MAARTGMTEIIKDLRALTNAGTADYSIAGAAYWSDDQLQDILDTNREDLYFIDTHAIPRIGVGGTPLYYRYELKHKTIESGTAFSLQDPAGSAVGTANYALDSKRGFVMFSTDQRGTSYFANYATYDIYAAAADVWETKAANYADQFTFSTDNHSVQLGQLITQAQKMAEKYRSMSMTSINVIDCYRGDQC